MGDFQLQGAITALVTPFRDGQLDEKALMELVDAQIAGGVSGLVMAGTTGESPTLSDRERVRLFRAVVKRVKGRITVIAGAGSYDTRKACERAKEAQQCGADALLVVTPYYNKPTQNGLFLHYQAVAAASKLPIVLYNVPGRTGVSLAAETVARLAKIPNIVAIKEASGTLELTSRIRSLCDITILSGDDALTLPMMALGAKGVISVASNLIPREISELCREALRGNFEHARRIHERCQGLFRALFLESNPIPVKTALRLLGRTTGELRLPLCPMEPAGEQKLAEEMRRFGLLGGRQG